MPCYELSKWPSNVSLLSYVALSYLELFVMKDVLLLLLCNFRNEYCSLLGTVTAARIVL